MGEKSVRNVGGLTAVDFSRMFRWRTFYIMLGISFVIPILVAVMTGMSGDAAGAGFETVWQLIGSTGSAGMSMDLTTMCNMNLVYFLAAVLAVAFISADFRSGFSKSLFSVRTGKRSYVVSKTVTCFIAGALMLLCFFVGALLAGKFAGLSFEMTDFNAYNLICCMISKIFMMLVFIGIYVLMGTLGKERTWMGLLLSLFAGMFMFMMIDMTAPLDAGVMNIVLCAAGGVIFAGALSCLSSAVLKRRDIL